MDDFKMGDCHLIPLITDLPEKNKTNNEKSNKSIQNKANNQKLKNNSNIDSKNLLNKNDVCNDHKISVALFVCVDSKSIF